MTTPEARYYTQASIIPHWLSHTTLWYLRTSASNITEFIFADLAAPSRRPAFDHALLASKLAEHAGSGGGEGIDASSLPFSWIDLAPDASTVRFRFSGKTFQFRTGETAELEVWEGDFGTKLEPLATDEPSVNGGDKAGVILLNKTAGVLKVFWIDTKGVAVEYGSIEAGNELEMRTYVGHVWRVEGEKTGEKRVYRAVEGEGVAVVEGWEERTAETVVEERKEDRDAEEEVQGVFVRDDHVWVRDDEGEHDITEAASAGTRYDATRIFSSPDGKFAVVWAYTPEEGYTLNLVESTPKDQLQPKLNTMSYLKPGDKRRIDRPRMFDVEAKAEVSTDDSLFQNPYNIYDLGWSKDGDEYRFIFNERGHQRLRVVGMDRHGAVRSLVEESSETFIDYSQKMFHLLSPDTTELLWTSERSGWNHLYLYDMKAGELKTQVTSGEWVVRDVERVDWETRQVWLTVYGIIPDQDPYYAHLVRVDLDSGSGFTLLTEGDGTHSWKWSPGNDYLLDTYSRINQLPVTTARDCTSGNQIISLEGDETGALIAEGWTAPEIFTAPGRDGTTLIHGIIVLPKDFDPSKRYAVIEDIYAGPQDFFTPKPFIPDLGQRVLADQGFVVVKLDGMGTNWRSKAFHDVCHKNLKDSGIPDRIGWIKAAASTRPWMDLSRVGICGGSAGGQSAAAALIFHAGFYKAAVADCGCHDNRLDKMWWNEQWMGWPVDESYSASSNVVHAKDLVGALLLIVGELDDNVDPASTLQLVKALNDADKDYDMLLIPGKGHGAGDSEYGRRRRLQFFRKWLEVDGS